MANLKVKKLEKNSRNITHLAIDSSSDTTLIFFRGISKITGDIQWYESKISYRFKDAEKVYTSGDFAQILSDGITKSKIQNWHKSQSEIDSQTKKLEKLSKEELIEMIIKLAD